MGFIWGDSSYRSHFLASTLWLSCVKRQSTPDYQRPNWREWETQRNTNHIFFFGEHPAGIPSLLNTLLQVASLRGNLFFAPLLSSVVNSGWRQKRSKSCYFIYIAVVFNEVTHPHLNCASEVGCKTKFTKHRTFHDWNHFGKWKALKLMQAARIGPGLGTVSLKPPTRSNWKLH